MLREIEEVNGQIIGDGSNLCYIYWAFFHITSEQTSIIKRM